MFSLDSGWESGAYDETVACVWLTRSSTGRLAGSTGIPGHAPPQHIGNPGMGRQTAAGPLTRATVVMR